MNMGLDEGDMERWEELPGMPEIMHEQPAGPQIDHIGAIQVEGDVFAYNSPRSKISLRHEPEKGLSFQIWPSSLALAKLVEAWHATDPDYWKSKTILELGCGCGLVGLVLASLGAHVALTDLPKTMDLLEENMAANSSAIQSYGGSAVAFPLVWGETDCSTIPEPWRHPDVVVAADVIYHRELMSPLLQALNSLAVKNGAIVLLAHVRRWKHDKHFFTAVKKTFTVEDISEDSNLANQGNKQAGRSQASHTRGALRVYKLTKSC